MGFNIDGPSGPLQIALVFLLGFATIGYGGYSYATQSAALGSAEKVNASIVSTSVETDPQRRGTSYSPRVTFNYTYEGASYTSSNVYPGPLPRTFDTESAARSVIAEYEPGRTGTAYVPPSEPENAFLEYEQSNDPFFVMGFGVLFVLFGAYSALREFFG